MGGARAGRPGGRASAGRAANHAGRRVGDGRVHRGATARGGRCEAGSPDMAAATDRPNGVVPPEPRNSAPYQRFRPRQPGAAPPGAMAGGGPVATWEPGVAARIAELRDAGNARPGAPLLVAIAGNPGSGKTTSASLLASAAFGGELTNCSRPLTQSTPGAAAGKTRRQRVRGVPLRRLPHAAGGAPGRTRRRGPGVPPRRRGHLRRRALRPPVRALAASGPPPTSPSPLNAGPSPMRHPRRRAAGSGRLSIPPAPR